MEEAIQNRNFPNFAQLTCSDSNQFHAVCMDASPPIFYMNDTSHRVIGCVEKWNVQKELHSFKTLSCSRSNSNKQLSDLSGPNAVLIARNRKAATLMLQRLLFHFPPNSDTDLNSYVIGDKSILKDAGIQDIKDVEALPPPPQIQDKVPAQKYKGEISYFICTRPGRGPVLLTDENQALLNPETGLPKRTKFYSC